MRIPVLVEPETPLNLIQVGAASHEDKARLLAASEGYAPETVRKEYWGEEVGEVFIVSTPPKHTTGDASG